MKFRNIQPLLTKIFCIQETFTESEVLFWPFYEKGQDLSKNRTKILHLHQEHNTKSLGKMFLGFACFSLCGDSGNQHILRHSHDVNIVGSQNLLVLMESKALHIRFAERKKLCMIFFKKNAFVV